MKADSSRVAAALIGYERQENLGLRSLKAYLEANGFPVFLLAYEPGREEPILGTIGEASPALVGFSIIFQYSIDQFRDLAAYLRAKGIQGHFTAGGHFPSLRPQEALALIPELDSVVCSEGELTLVDLLRALDRPESWGSIRGLAYRTGSGIVVNEPRELIVDLDSLPLLYRDPQEATAGTIGTASMIASRGCLHDCSFCSIRQFYGSSPGALRRVRSPKAVVGEMRRLSEQAGVRYFSFQDDDFAARTRAQREWVGVFLRELDLWGVGSAIRWKISCRVDDLNPDLLAEMVGHGLMAVYLGVESGSEEGLRTLNKGTTVARNLEAVQTVKRAGIALAVGFMLLDPSSNFRSIRENISFLRAIGEDGYLPINFCKMLPYAGTPIEADLRRSGRLTGSAAYPDYRFLDSRLDWFELAVQQIFSRRNFSPDGIVALLQQADIDRRFMVAFGGADPHDIFSKDLSGIIASTNTAATESLQSLLDAIECEGVESLLKRSNTLVEIAEKEWRAEMEAEVLLRKLELQRNRRPC